MSRRGAVLTKHLVLFSAVVVAYVVSDPLTRTLAIIALGVFGMCMDRIERRCMEDEREDEHARALRNLETRLASAEQAQALNGAAPVSID